MAYIKDQLIAYDVATEQRQLLHEFETPNAYLLQITTTDFDTFYFLTAPAHGSEIDASTAEPQHTEKQKRLYDSAESMSKILTYQQSTRRETTLIETDTAFPPQTGIHYHQGVDSEDLQWHGITPFNKAGFAMDSGYLYYRYATQTEFGVARVDRTGITEKVISAERDAYQNHLNFAFTLEGSDVIFGYTQGTTDDSELIIKRQSGATETTLLQRKESIANLTILDAIGGAFLGIYEMVIKDDSVYMIVPIARQNRDNNRTAGVAIYRYGLNTLQLEVLRTWEFVHWGPTSLTVHGENVYYLECPPAFYEFEPRNPDFTEEQIAEIRANSQGYLRCIEESGGIRDLGNLWYEGHPYRAALTKILPYGDDLNMIVASDSPEVLLVQNGKLQHFNDVQWLTWTRHIKFHVDIPTTGSVYDALVGIAEKVNATFSVDRNIIQIKTRTPIGALTQGHITQTETTEIA